MNMYWVLAVLIMEIGIGVSFLACSSSGGGDDDSRGGSDDDNGSNDDDASGDDDAWTDSSSGLTWQDPPASEWMTWEEAIAYCDNLSFDGHYDWRLPTISDLRSLIRGCDATVTGGACEVTDGCLGYDDCWNDPCDECEYRAGPGPEGRYWPDGMSGAIDSFWSSSAVADLVDYAW